MGWWRRVKAWWGGAGGEAAPERVQSLLNPILLDALYEPQLRDCYRALRDWEAALEGEGGEGAERALHVLRVLMVQAQRLAFLASEAQPGAASVYEAQRARLVGYVEALARAAAAPQTRRAQAVGEVCAQAAADVEALRGVMPRSSALLGAISGWGRSGGGGPPP